MTNKTIEAKVIGILDKQLYLPAHPHLGISGKDQATAQILSLMREIVPEVLELEGVIDFLLQHLVSKVTDENDYISRDERIQGHRQSIACACRQAMLDKIGG